MGAGSVDGSQLGAKHFRMVQREANASIAEERIRLVRGAEIGRHLVAAQVHGAKDHRARREAGRNLAIRQELFLLAGQLGAIQVEELGAEQTDAVGARLEHVLDFDRQLDVGAELLSALSST